MKILEENLPLAVNATGTLYNDSVMYIKIFFYVIFPIWFCRFQTCSFFFREVRKRKRFFSIALYIAFTRHIRELVEKECPIRVIATSSLYIIKIASRNFSVFTFFFRRNFNNTLRIFLSGISHALNWQHSFSETRFVVFFNAWENIGCKIFMKSICYIRLLHSINLNIIVPLNRVTHTYIVSID